MLILLQRIPAAWLESFGTFAAGLAWLAIGAQLHGEIITPGASHLAILNVVGFLLCFSFWTIYGLRFARPAVWIGNLVAVILQLALLAVVIYKDTCS